MRSPRGRYEGVGSLRRPQVQAVEPVPKRRACDPELPGCTAQVASGGREGSAESVVLDRIFTCSRLPVSEGDLDRILVEDGRVRPNRCAIEDVRELPDVAGPRVGLENCDGVGGELSMTHLLLDAVEEVLRKHRDVLLAAAKRWQLDREAGEAVVEVGPEGAGGDEHAEIRRPSNDQPHIDSDSPLRADRTKFPGLEDSQELRLGVRPELCDLVEEEGPARGLLEESAVWALGAREGAPDMAEELTSEEALWQRGGVHRDEGTVRSWPRRVEGVGHELLPRARLAGDDDGSLDPGVPMDLRTDALDRG